MRRQYRPLLNVAMQRLREQRAATAIQRVRGVLPARYQLGAGALGESKLCSPAHIAISTYLVTRQEMGCSSLPTCRVVNAPPCLAPSLATFLDTPTP